MHAPSHLRRFLRTIVRNFEAHYPPFVFGLPLAQDETPVFAYHDVIAEDFAADLSYLATNSYRTLSLAKFLQGSRDVGSRGSVLLTFDDARRNFFDVALPILERYDCRATLFVPTAWVGAERRTGLVPLSESQRMFMTWDEVRYCEAHPLVDVELHGHRHGLIHTSAKLVDFASPQMLARYDIFDWPMRSVAGRDRLGFPAPGTPIYEAAPILAAERRFVEDESIVSRCLETVAANGGETFFDRPGWDGTLRRVHDEAQASHPPPRFLEEEVFSELVSSEFTLSRTAFERELGRAPGALAYPWRLGSARSLAYAAAAGIEAAFGVALDHRRIQQLQSPVRLFSRLKADWLRCLPGESRRTLWHLLPDKLAKFARTQHLAH
jgi:peptidoglycan/xylan/chitin deacetylase (PgdA/CDA1 family)